jgi:hypothetical protein
VAKIFIKALDAAEVRKESLLEGIADGDAAVLLAGVHVLGPKDLATHLSQSPR